MLVKGAEFWFSHPAPSLFVVHAFSEKTRQKHLRSSPMEKGAKCLNLLGRKVLSSSLKVRIASYQALLVKYKFLNYAKFAEFTDSLPQ